MRHPGVLSRDPAATNHQIARKPPLAPSETNVSQHPPPGQGEPPWSPSESPPIAVAIRAETPLARARPASSVPRILGLRLGQYLLSEVAAQILWRAEIDFTTEHPGQLQRHTGKPE